MNYNSAEFISTMWLHDQDLTFMLYLVDYLFIFLTTILKI